MDASEIANPAEKSMVPKNDLWCFVYSALLIRIVAVIKLRKKGIEYDGVNQDASLSN